METNLSPTILLADDIHHIILRRRALKLFEQARYLFDP